MASFLDFLSSLPIKAVVLDCDGRVVLATPSWFALMYLKQGDVEGRLFADILKQLKVHEDAQVYFDCVIGRTFGQGDFSFILPCGYEGVLKYQVSELNMQEFQLESGCMLRLVSFEDVTMDVLESRLIRDIVAFSHDRSVPRDDRLNLILKSTADFLRLSFGAIGRVDHDDYEVITFYDGGDAGVVAHKKYPIADLYGSSVLAVGDVVAFEQVGNSLLKDTAWYQSSGYESYIGAPLFVHQVLYGVIGFSSKLPRNGLFSQKEKSLVRVVAQIIGFEFTFEQIIHGLQQSEQTLRQSNERLLEFANATSHDLKAPLSALLYHTQNIEELLGQDIHSEVQTHLLLMRSRIERMGLFLDEILSHARFSEHEITLHHDRISGLELSCRLRDMVLVPAGFELSFDPLFLETTFLEMPVLQILHNLITNAFKHHGKTEGHVRVGLMQDDETQQIGVFVEDDGQGIETRDLSRVFDVFYRRSSGGHGFGLALVKKLAMSHRGDVRVYSEVGSGARFEVIFQHDTSLIKR